MALGKCPFYCLIRELYEYKPGGLSSPEGGMLANGWSGGSGGHPDMGNGCSRPGKPRKYTYKKLKNNFKKL